MCGSTRTRPDTLPRKRTVRSPVGALDRTTVDDLLASNYISTVVTDWSNMGRKESDVESTRSQAPAVGFPVVRTASIPGAQFHLRVGHVQFELLNGPPEVLREFLLEPVAPHSVGGAGDEQPADDGALQVVDRDADRP